MWKRHLLLQQPQHAPVWVERIKRKNKTTTMTISNTLTNALRWLTCSGIPWGVHRYHCRLHWHGARLCCCTLRASGPMTWVPADTTSRTTCPTRTTVVCLTWRERRPQIVVSSYDRQGIVLSSRPGNNGSDPYLKIWAFYLCTNSQIFFVLSVHIPRDKKYNLK